MRPEQNMYLVDGAQNVNRMDGGYALKLPVEAIAEFRILTQSAPPEYGGTGGATTSVVTRSGSNQFHGNLYEFLRNDVFDARNFFSAEVEPLKQNQFGGTIGGPITQGQAAVLRLLRRIPQQAGHDDDRDGADRAGAAGRLLGDVDAAAQSRGRRRAVSRQPDSAGGDQPGRPERREPVPARQRLAVHLPRDARRRKRSRSGRRPRRLQPVEQHDQIFGRYSYSGGHNINPISVRGTDVPGFPTRDDIATHAATLSSTHILSPSLTNPVRGTLPAITSSSSTSASTGRRRARSASATTPRTTSARVRRSSTSAAIRRSAARSPVRATRRSTPSKSRTALTWTRGAPPRQGRRRVQAHRDRHGSGDRAERVLRVRRHVPDQQCRGQPAARRAGHVLPGPRRLQPRIDVMGLGAVRAGRVATRRRA